MSVSKRLNLYLISQTVNDDYGTYSDAVVAASSEEEAKTIHPGGDDIRLPAPDLPEDHDDYHEKSYWPYHDWVRDPKDVQCKLIGRAIEGTEVGPVCSSYHAG